MTAAKHLCEPPSPWDKEAPETWCCPVCLLEWELRQERWYQPTEEPDLTT